MHREINDKSSSFCKVFFFFFDIYTYHSCFKGSGLLSRFIPLNWFLTPWLPLLINGILAVANKTFSSKLENINKLIYCSINFLWISHKLVCLEDLSELHFSVCLFSDPGDKILIICESKEQICPKLFVLLRTLPSDWRTAPYWNVFLTIFQECSHMSYSWKTDGTTLQCILCLQSRGQDIIYCWNSM